MGVRMVECMVRWIMAIGGCRDDWAGGGTESIGLHEYMESSSEEPTSNLKP